MAHQKEGGGLIKCISTNNASLSLCERFAYIQTHTQPPAALRNLVITPANYLSVSETVRFACTMAKLAIVMSFTRDASLPAIMVAVMFQNHTSV